MLTKIDTLSYDVLRQYESIYDIYDSEALKTPSLLEATQSMKCKNLGQFKLLNWAIIYFHDDDICNIKPHASLLRIP